MIRRFFEFSHFDHETFEDEIAERVVRLSAGYGSLAIALFALSFWLTGPSEFVPANLIVAFLLAVIAIFRPVGPQFSVFLAGSMALLLIGYQLVMLGGLSHSPAVWLLVPGVAVLLIGMRRLSLQLSSVSMLIVFGILVGERLGWVRERVRLPDPESQTAASLIGSQALVLLLGFLILRARDRLMAENRERTRQLAEALDHAKLARTEAEQARNEAITARNEALTARNEAVDARGEAESSRNEALEAVRQKEQFFANLTHEIRTPLGGVVGVAAMLERGHPRPDQRPFVDALNASARELSEVVESMLDHARLSVGQFSNELAPLSLRELVDSLQALFAERASRQGLAFDCQLSPDTPDWVVSDRMWLRRILSNLIGNALKFTQAGSVRLSLRAQPEDGEGIRLIAEVSDTGIGIPADKIESIFQPFVQADSSITRRFGGTGLGLAISKRLAELLGGELRVRSSVGEGSVFMLTLPVQIAAEPAPLEPSASLSQPEALVSGESEAAALSRHGLRVLLVEDNPVNLMLGEEMLRSLGCEVVVAEHGGIAVAQASEQRFDLILMDLQMPQVDGISATRAIREHEARQARAITPIYALTGNSASDYGDACRDAGMQGFLTKPIGLDALQALLAAVASGALADG